MGHMIGRDAVLGVVISGLAGCLAEMGSDGIVAAGFDTDVVGRPAVPLEVPEPLRGRQVVELVGALSQVVQAEADQVKRQLAYASFASLVRTHSLRPGARETAGDLGFLTAQALGPLAEDVFGASEGAVLGPLEIQGRYLLLHVGEPYDPVVLVDALNSSASAIRRPTNARPTQPSGNATRSMLTRSCSIQCL